MVRGVATEKGEDLGPLMQSATTLMLILLPICFMVIILSQKGNRASMEYISHSHIRNKQNYFFLFTFMHNGLKSITVVSWSLNITRASMLQGLTFTLFIIARGAFDFNKTICT